MTFLSVRPNLIVRGTPASEMRFEDFMNLKFDELLNEDFEVSDNHRKYADVGIINGEVDSRSARLYLKRTYHEPLRKAFRQMKAFRIPHYNTMREAIAIKELTKRGFLVNEALAFGEYRFMGFPRASFLLSREVPGTSLRTLFRRMPADDRSAAMREFGDLLARLHDCGFFQRLKFCDLIYRKTSEGSCELVVIDRDVSSPWPKKFALKRLAIQNTASSVKHIFSDFPMSMSARDGLSFLQGYKHRSNLFRESSKREWYHMIKSELMHLLKEKPIPGNHGVRWRV